VYATNDPLFSSAMEALETIDISGHPRIDSYDSRDPKYSTTNGGYKIGAFKDKGDIVAYAGVLNSVSLGNSDIYGHVITGPEGTLNLAKGTVGSVAWHDAGNTGVQPGWYKQTALPDYPPVEAPAPGGPATGGTIDKVSYQYIVGNGNYSVDAISGSVLVTGQATLTVNKSFSLSGNSSLTINKGASLKLYVNAPSVSVAGNGIVNQNTDAGTFMYFGLPGNTDIKLAGNGGFCGVIYAPNAALTLSGGGKSPLDFMGATITRKVTVNGHYNFHYDEATQRLLMRGYVVKSWDEL